MAIKHLNLLLLTICLGFTFPATAQFLEVVAIDISGNKRTRDRIILRELEFQVGDQIQQSQLSKELDKNRYNLLATGLFTDVSMNIRDWKVEAQEIEISIVVNEGPWLIPVPIFELADRNFNVWVNEFDASFKRVNYGVNIGLYNTWGYGEKFKMVAQFGYTPKFTFSALLPFLDNNQTVRMELDASYSVNKQVPVFTRENKRVFREALDDHIIFKRQNYQVGLLFRPKIFATHFFHLGYANNWVDEAFMLENNPDFFLDGRSRQQYIFADYELRYDKRNLPILATEGWYVGFKFYKNGFGFFNDVSSTFIEPRFEYYQSFGPRLVASVALSGKAGLEREKQPYYNYRGLGYGQNFIRGYELYVTDGMDYFLSKLTLQFKFWESQLNWSKIMPIKGLRAMPFRFYFAVNYDSGYTNDPFYYETNNFTNRWLHGGGIGVNIVLYNTALIQVEFSTNHLGEKGVFLRTDTAF